MHEMSIGKCNFSLKMTNNTGRNLIGSISISYLCLLKTFDWYLFFFFILFLKKPIQCITLFLKNTFIFYIFVPYFKVRTPLKGPSAVPVGTSTFAWLIQGSPSRKCFFSNMWKCMNIFCSQQYPAPFCFHTPYLTLIQW